jgi:threonine/homoserine efflux transporter RhtA
MRDSTLPPFAAEDRRQGRLTGEDMAFDHADLLLPMSLVAAIEFVGTIGVALYGLRMRRSSF